MKPKHPLANCAGCPLYNRPYVPDAPVDDPELIVVGEAPGEIEARHKTPFVGQSGKLLAQLVSQAGGRVTKVSRHNVVACRPPDNRTPTPEEIARCVPRIYAAVEGAAVPVMPLGITAADVFARLSNVPHFKLSAQLGKWHTATLPSGTQVKWIPSWHPAYALRTPSTSVQLRADIKRAYEGERINEVLATKPEVFIIRTFEEMVAALSRAPKDVLVSFDIETDNTNWYSRPGRPRDGILMLAIAWKPTFGLAIDADLLYDDDRAVPYVEQWLAAHPLCAHNGKFDVIFLRTGLQLHVREKFDIDTMLAHYALDEEPGGQGLKKLAYEEFGLPDYEEELIAKYLKSKNDLYSKIPFDQFAVYAVWDVVITLRLATIYRERLQAQTIEHGPLAGKTRWEWPFINLLMATQATLTQVEINGIPIDAPYLRAWRERLLKERDRYAEEFRQITDSPNLNLNSAPQMAALLYDKLKLPDPAIGHEKHRKLRSTDREAIVRLRGAHDCIDILSKYRRIQKMVSSYVNNLLTYVDNEGRVHPSYKVHGTETGRLAASDPAIQTIPRPDDRYGAILRSAFVPEPGHVFVIVDYSQGELRCAAALSRDEFLLRVYEENRDLHSEVARAMFGEHFTKADRARCKMFNFSYLYGGNEYSFADSAGLPIEIARRFVKDYNRVMGGLARWKEHMIHTGLTRGYVESVLGRRRYFKVVALATKDEIVKAAVNAPVQATTSDFNLIAGNELVAMGLQLMISVHDANIFHARIEDAPEVARIATAKAKEVAMRFLPEVKWEADAEIATRWCPTPPEYVLSHISGGEVVEDYDIDKLVKWVGNEPEARKFLLQAQTCEPSERAGFVRLAGKSLEVL